MERTPADARGAERASTSPGLLPDADSVTPEQVAEMIRAMYASMDEFVKAHEVTQEILEMKISV